MLRKKEGSGTVTISTEETEIEIIVTVKDNGVGFDPTQKKDSGKTHIGIENVRSCLAAQCGGSLTVKSAPEVGTTVIITIPKGENKDEYHSSG